MIVRCCFLKHSMKKKKTELQEYKEQLREALANYMMSEGCSCCSDRDSHEEHTKVLAKLLGVRKYQDGSGYNFPKYRTEKS